MYKNGDSPAEIGYSGTHISAALLELGRPDLAELSFMNRGGLPAIHFCGLGRAPSMVEITLVSRAFNLWYERFRPDKIGPGLHEVSFDPEIWYRTLIQHAPHHPKDCRACGGHPYRPRT